MTIGQMMLVGGITGAALFLVLLILLFATAGKKRQKLKDKITESYEE